MTDFATSAVPQQESPGHRHAVQFYESAGYLSTVVSDYLSPGFKNGNAMVLIARAATRKAILQRLQDSGFDVDSISKTGQLQELDAQETLQTFMDSDQPNPVRFKTVIGNVLDQCRPRSGKLPILAYGEMVDILWNEGRCEAALRLEELWNELAGSHSFELLCAYCLKGFGENAQSRQFEQVCSAHTRVAPTEAYMSLGENERLLQITALQQQALALEAEIRHRKEADKALLRALDEQRQVERALRTSEKNLRSLLENAAEGIHWVDAKGGIVWANRADLELVGYAPEEYIGHHISEFHTDTQLIANILERLKNGETLRNQEARLRARDGSVRHVLINSNAIWDDEGFVHTQCFTRDITALKLAQEAQWVLGAIVESADDAIVSKTLDGIITSWNPGARRLFGYTADEVVGKSITLLVPDAYRDEEPLILEKLRRGERVDHYETKRVRKDGTIIDISLTISPVRDQSGQIIGASKIARDITERRRFEAERAQLLEKEKAARQEAEAASRIKDEFLAVVSHELRTPLNAVLGWTAVLERQRGEDTVIQAVEVIKRNAGIQKRMIEDLLDMGRILAGKMTIKTEQVNLLAVSNAALETVAPAAAAKGIRIEKHFDESLPSITGDADRLQQVAWNLLSNSIKFTPQNGTVHLVIKCDASHLELRVSDTGKGIHPDFIPHIFERFAQGDSSLSRQQAGLGIGLALVRYLVEAHGGRVWADSPGEGLGSTFTVQLPVTFLKRPYVNDSTSA
jgi:PAS domain S-box-containing protein